MERARTLEQARKGRGEQQMAKAKSGKRIFLSYGHDAYSKLALRLQRALERHGHQVWFDLDRLKTGVDWEAYIEAGLDWVAERPSQGVLLLLMTPHSVRRPDGFCHNELARAISRRITVLPIMVAACDVPLSICRIQYLDMRDCWPPERRQGRYRVALTQLLQVLKDGRLDIRGAQARLLRWLSPLPFDADIERHCVRFVGRQWIIGRIDQWLADPQGSRVFWITGKPGAGKSALAARLYATRPEIAAIHFCVQGHTGKADPRQAILSIAFQLSCRLPDYQRQLAALNLEEISAESGVKTLFDYLFLQPLAGLDQPPDRTLVVLVDAVDEATMEGTNGLAELIASEFSKAPRWLRVIVTSRSERPISQLLQAFTPCVLETTTRENKADLRSYLLQELRPYSPRGRIAPHIVDTILAKSEGLFLYAKYLVTELRERRVRLDGLRAIPQGLGGIYFEFFHRQFPDVPAFESQLRPVLEIIAAAHEELPLDDLKLFFAWSDYDRREITRKLGALFSSGPCIAPFHRSVLDWLGDEEKAGPYFTSVEQGHVRLADFGWRAYESGVGRMPAYLVVYLPAHLVAAGRLTALQRLLLDFHWLQAKLGLADPIVLMRDFEAARGDENTDLVREAIGLSIQSLARNRNELPSQLLARLRPASDTIRNLLAQASACATHYWLRPLQSQLTSPGGSLRFTLKGHFAHINGLQITSDSRYLVSSSPDGMIKIWELATGQERCTIRVPAQILDLAVTPDSKLVIAGTDTGHLGVWDMASGKRLHVLSGHHGFVEKVVVVPPGASVISIGSDGSLIMWDLRAGAAAHEFPKQLERITVIGVADDGGLAATGSDCGSLVVWNLRSKRKLHRIDAHGDRIVTALALASSYDRLVTASDAGEIKVWSLKRARLVKSLCGRGATVNDLAISADGRKLLSACGDGTLGYWDLPTGRLLSSIGGYGSSVRRVVFTPNGQKAVFASDDSTIKVWDLLSDAEPRSLGGHAGSVWELCLAPDGVHLASGGVDSTVRVWNITTGETSLMPAKAHLSNVRSVAISSDGLFTVSGSQDNTLKVWGLPSLTLRRTLSGHTDWVHSVAITHDCKRIVSGSSDDTIKIWDVATGAEIRSIACGSRVKGVYIKDDDSLVFSVTENGRLTAWQLDNGRKSYEVELHWTIHYDRAAATSNDGSRIVVAPHLDVDSWNLRSQLKERTFKTDTLEEVSAVALSPDGAIAAVAEGVSHHSVIRLWQVQTGACLASFDGPPCRVNDLVFFTDHRRLAYAADYGWIGVWDVVNNSLIASYSTDGSISACAVAPDGRHVVAGDELGCLHVLRLEGWP